MLTLFLLHLYISVTCLLAGFLVHTYVLKFIEPQPAEEYKPVMVYLITGLITLTAICQWIILFHPLTTEIKLIVAATLLTCIGIARKRCAVLLRDLWHKLFTEPVITVAVLLTWLLIIILNSGPTMMDDTDSYHIQMIKWIEEYGSVPGLVNLHERYGFNTSWFSSIAFFNLPGQQVNFYTGLNGAMSLWFAGYLLSRTGKYFSNSSYKLVSVSIACLFIFIISMVAWPLLRGNAATCNYDFISTLVVFVLCCEMLMSMLKTGKVKLTAAWIIWPVYLFTVRIINYPYLLLTLFGMLTLWRERKFIPITSICLFSLLIIVPFVVRNIILSGYAFYPSLSFDWFNVDWKAPKEKTLQLLRFIKYFNRVNAGYQDIEITERLLFPQWVSSWFRHLLWYDKLVLIPGVTGLFAAMLFIKRPGRSLNVYFLVFLCALLFQCISWFLVAPDPRFIYGTLLAGIVSGFALFNGTLSRIKWVRLIKPVLILTIASLPVISIFKVISTPQYRNWIFPLPLPQPPLKTVTIRQAGYHIPEKILTNWNSRCYGSPLPCLYELSPGLEMRGSSLSQGFRIKK